MSTFEESYYMQLKYLRVLDASCNELSKVQGLSENKVRSVLYYSSSVNCYQPLGAERAQIVWKLH